MLALAALLDLAGIDRERVWLKWVSSAEGKLFAEYATSVSQAIEQLGPFDLDRYRLPLAAMRRTLSTTRIRWLTGMERELEEHGNVYGEKIPPDRYHEVLGRALREEYEQALVLESLDREEGRQVRQIAAATGLAVPAVSACLVNLERDGLAAVAGYDDRDPRLVRAGD